MSKKVSDGQTSNMSVLPLRGFLRTSRRKLEKVIYKVETFGLVVKKVSDGQTSNMSVMSLKGFLRTNQRKSETVIYTVETFGLV